MNVIDKWFFEGEDFDEGVEIYCRFGDNENLKNTYKKGFAVFDIAASLRNELNILKDKPYIPKAGKPVIKVKATKEKVTVPELSKQPTLIDKVDYIVRNNGSEADQMRKSIQKLTHQRNKLANELTNDAISIVEAQEKIKVIKYLLEERKIVENKLKHYLKSGEIPKQNKVQSDHDRDVESISDKAELQLIMKRARTRRAKANRNMKQKPNRRKYYERIAKREEQLITRCLNQIDHGTGK